jgi:hypothetical protein
LENTLANRVVEDAHADVNKDAEGTAFLEEESCFETEADLVNGKTLCLDFSRTNGIIPPDDAENDERVDSLFQHTIEDVSKSLKYTN